MWTLPSFKSHTGKSLVTAHLHICHTRSTLSPLMQDFSIQSVLVGDTKLVFPSSQIGNN